MSMWFLSKKTTCYFIMMTPAETCLWFVQILSLPLHPLPASQPEEHGGPIGQL